MLESKHVKNLFDTSEIEELTSLIHANKKEVLDVNINLKSGNLWARDHVWDYYSDSNMRIRSILEPKIERVVEKTFTVGTSHILESFEPYNIHNDTHHRNNSENPEYVFLIPLDDTPSATIVFNEYATESNEFSVYKNTTDPHENFSIDKTICQKYLTHLHPKDLQYLSIKDIFEWSKGDLIVFDRKYFHCSDNYKRNGLSSKKCIILWTYTKH